MCSHCSQWHVAQALASELRWVKQRIAYDCYTRNDVMHACTFVRTTVCCSYMRIKSSLLLLLNSCKSNTSGMLCWKIQYVYVGWTINQRRTTCIYDPFDGFHLDDVCIYTKHDSCYYFSFFSLSPAPPPALFFRHFHVLVSACLFCSSLVRMDKKKKPKTHKHKQKKNKQPNSP